MSVLAAYLLAVVPTLLAPAGGDGQVPLEVDRWGRVIVRAHIGPAGPFRFLLDTGSTLSAVTAEVASRLELPGAGRVAIQSLGRRGSARLVHAPPLRIGHRLVALRWMLVLERGRLDPSVRLDGVLGQDLLGQLDYLVAPSRGVLWIDPPAPVLRSLDGVHLPLRGAFGPLVVVDRGGAQWGIDSGASHPVIFREGIAAPTGERLDVMTTAGPHPVDRLGPASIDVGGQSFSWGDAVLQRRSDRTEHGLLPLAMFDAIYVDNGEGFAVLLPRARKAPRPDIAARLGALEDDAGATRRPGRIADVAVGHPVLGELRDLSGPRRD